MNKSITPKLRPNPHVDSVNFIKNLKQRVTRQARYRQVHTAKSYTECLEDVCMDFGFDGRKSYANILKALELQSDRIFKDTDRQRCLSKEEVAPNTEYFVVRGKLQLEVSLINDSDSRMKVAGVYMEGVYWPDSLKALYDSSIQAEPIKNPAEFLTELRLAGEKDVYVINHKSDLESWVDGWSGIAFIQEKLARKNFDIAMWLSLES